MDRLDKVVHELRAFVAEREWEQFHDPKNLAMAVASEAGELLAEYRWVSNTEVDDYSRGERNWGQTRFSCRPSSNRPNASPSTGPPRITRSSPVLLEAITHD